MKKLIKVCLWFLAFTPVIIGSTHSMFFPFVTEKNIFLRGFLVLTNILLFIYFIYAKKFREEVTKKVKRYIKNPLTISILLFVTISIISAIFAVDKFTAFWGNIERAGGLTSLIFFFSFFVFNLLVFEKKDWLVFFKLSLLTSVIMLSWQFWQALGGLSRSGSFADNPTFLAGYLLFSIVCAIIIWSEAKKSRSGFWKYFSALILVLSVIGILLTQTRGTLLGLFVGIIAVLVYSAVKGKDEIFLKINLRKLSIAILCFLFLFAGIFTLTRQNEIWQKIPGLSRVSVVSAEDSTTETRLLLVGISLKAENPATNGWKKFLIGWGPDNFSQAYAEYFNPAQYKYETSWFDRAHDQLFDKLVMNGILGLLAYLAIWFFFFKMFFKKEFSVITVALLLFGTAFLIHLVFIFEEINTNMPFFAMLAFALYFSAEYGGGGKEKDVKEKMMNTAHDEKSFREIYIGGFLLILTIFLGYVFFANDLVGYIQMREYVVLRNSKNTEIISNGVNSVFLPFTSAQMNIRNDFLLITSDNYNANDTYSVGIFNLSLNEAEDYARRVPKDLQFINNLAYVYMIQGNILNNTKFFEKAEEYFKQILIFAPNIPSFEDGYAMDLYFLKKYDESLSYFEKAFNTEPTLYLRDGKDVENIYTAFFRYFYQNKDKTNFIIASKRLINNGYAKSNILSQIVDYIEKYDKWPDINLN